MLNPDFERDANLLQGTGVTLSNDDDGQLLVNAVEADSFDPRSQNDIEGLLFLGKLTRKCDIYGHPIILKTLTRGERLATTLVVKEYEESLGAADALQTAFLAAAIVTVDGRALSIPLSPHDDENPILRIRTQFDIIAKWYDPILEALFVEFGNLVLRQASAFAALQGNWTASRLTP